ncbi:MAG TPA: hypothetical protein VKD90_02195 [Gemmataceae bacterium]|nr:hypothetical protein [Gemmataceae bacterium]
MNQPLSPMAQALLRGHRPNVAAYLSLEVLGGTIHGESDLRKIDQAYEELVRAGLMEQTSGTFTILPRIVRHQFKLTEDGNKVLQNLR